MRCSELHAAREIKALATQPGAPCMALRDRGMSSEFRATVAQSMLFARRYLHAGAGSGSIASLWGSWARPRRPPLVLVDLEVLLVGQVEVLVAAAVEEIGNGRRFLPVFNPDRWATANQTHVSAANASWPAATAAMASSLASLEPWRSTACRIPADISRATPKCRLKACSARPGCLLSCTPNTDGPKAGPTRLDHGVLGIGLPHEVLGGDKAEQAVGDRLKPAIWRTRR